MKSLNNKIQGNGNGCLCGNSKFKRVCRNVFDNVFNCVHRTLVTPVTHQTAWNIDRKLYNEIRS